MKSNTKIILLSSVLACTALFTSCSDKNNSGTSSSMPASLTDSGQIKTVDTDSSSNTVEKDKDFGITLNQIKDANNFDLVLKDSTTTYECNCTYYNDDGSQQNKIYTGVQIKDGQYYYINEASAGDVIYTDSQKGKCYSYIPVNSFGVPYGIKFIDTDMVKKDIEQFNNDHIQFSDYEKITDAVTEEGLITLTTETPVSEETQGDLSDFYSYVNMNLFTTIKRTYKINEDTKLCTKSCAYGVTKEGQKIMLSETTITYSDNVIKIPGFVIDIDNMTDMRTINVIDESGKTDTYQVPKNVLFAYTSPNGYMMYTDKEGKEIFSNSDYLDKNVDIYILAVK